MVIFLDTSCERFQANAKCGSFFVACSVCVCVCLWARARAAIAVADDDGIEWANVMRNSSTLLMKIAYSYKIVKFTQQNELFEENVFSNEKRSH